MSNKLSQRKSDHIDLALNARTGTQSQDSRFIYEPMLSAFPTDTKLPSKFLGHSLDYPIWISSMTGGSEMAGIINKRLARLAGNYGLGMGLGSCRILLESNTHLADFDLKSEMQGQPLFANLGIAQVEEMLREESTDKIVAMLEQLTADGLIVHVNPLQEWMQDEGDVLKQAPVETIAKLKKIISLPLIIKEVGQGMGPDSIRTLWDLEVDAIEFAAFGGTNFTALERMRSDASTAYKSPFIQVGVTNEQMVDHYNAIYDAFDTHKMEVIVSGGISNYLDGYYFTKRIKGPAIYGMASAWLPYAQQSYEALEQFFLDQIKGLRMAQAYLKVASA